MAEWKMGDRVYFPASGTVAPITHVSPDGELYLRRPQDKHGWSARKYRVLHLPTPKGGWKS